MYYHLDFQTMQKLDKFAGKYGTEILLRLLDHYECVHETYLCKSEHGVTQIPIRSIQYIEIFGHDLAIHAESGIYHKYGTIKREYTDLKKKGFVKCNQSLLVPIREISEISGKHVFLKCGKKFSISRSCITYVMYEFSRYGVMEK